MANIVPTYFALVKSHSDLKEAQFSDTTFPEIPREDIEKLTWHLNLLPKSAYFQYSVLDILNQ